MATEDMAGTEALAFKREVARQIRDILAEGVITKANLARAMKTSRSQLDRMLDPENPILTFGSLGKVAAALGRKIEVRLVRE